MKNDEILKALDDAINAAKEVIKENEKLKKLHGVEVLKAEAEVSAMAYKVRGKIDSGIIARRHLAETIALDIVDEMKLAEPVYDEKTDQYIYTAYLFLMKEEEGDDEIES